MKFKNLCIAGLSATILLSNICYAFPAKVTADVLNIREYPSTNSSIIGTLSRGAIVEVEEFDSNWNKIVFNDGTEGYVHNLYLIKTENNTINDYMITFFTASDFQYFGLINWDGWGWTWYTSNSYPDDSNSLGIPGKHVDEDGYIKDENENFCLASSDFPKGTVVSTPFGGYGTVYDTGCPSGIFDVYTTW